jgi:hypothetical protein
LNRRKLSNERLRNELFRENEVRKKQTSELIGTWKHTSQRVSLDV